MARSKSTNRVSSAKEAREASRILRNPRSSKRDKALAGSVLSQAKSKKHK